MNYNYQKILNNIVQRMKESEKKFLFEVLGEELKKIQKDEFSINGYDKPRKIFWGHREWFDLRSENLKSLEIIKEELALESPLLSMYWLIEDLISSKTLSSEMLVAINFLAKCLSKTSEANLISNKIEKTILKKPNEYNADIIILMLKLNYGSYNLKYFNDYEKKFVIDLQILFKRFNRSEISGGVMEVNKALLKIIDYKIQNEKYDRKEKSVQKQEYINLLEDLKIEIENNLN
jgi:hypothetical protein